MDIIVTIVTISAIITISNIACFLLGAKTFQNVQKGEEVKLPNINPIEVVKEHIEERRERREAEREQERINIMLENINNYKGDATGQKDIPS